MFQQPTTQVLFELSRRTAAAQQAGNRKRVNGLINLRRRVEREFPEAKAEFDQRFPPLTTRQKP